jgi:hypothetical protein
MSIAVRPSDVKAKYFSGGEWNARKQQKGVRASRESGKKKGLVPPQWAKYICRSNRSYKHPDYSKWDSVCDGGKIKWSKA